MKRILSLLFLIMLGLSLGGCNLTTLLFGLSDDAEKLFQVRENIYKEYQHHRFTVGQVTHSFENSEFGDAVEERFEDTLPISSGKNIGFEYSINHVFGWLTDVTHYAFVIEGTQGDVLSMSHTNFGTAINYYLWRASYSELAVGLGGGIQYLEREFLTTDSTEKSSDDSLFAMAHLQYNQRITNGFALSYTVRVVNVQDYEFDNPSKDELNKIANESLRYRSGGAQVMVSFYFPFFTRPQ